MKFELPNGKVVERSLAEASVLVSADGKHVVDTLFEQLKAVWASGEMARAKRGQTTEDYSGLLNAIEAANRTVSTVR